MRVAPCTLVESESPRQASRAAACSSTRTAPPSMTPAQRLRNILGGSAGNFVEWFDWFAYASFALYFSRAFFPQGNQTAQLLNTALVFAGGFVARPIGHYCSASTPIARVVVPHSHYRSH